MDVLLQEKEAALKALLASYGSVAIAFSGGVDSTLLLDVAAEVLGAGAVGGAAGSAAGRAVGSTEGSAANNAAGRAPSVRAANGSATGNTTNSTAAEAECAPPAPAGAKVLAITAHSASFPQRERAAARAFCAERGIAHLEIISEELAVEGFAQNPPNRCYLCKRELFTKLAALAQTRGIAVLAEGSNRDDEGDYRPGLTAIAELGVASPLRTAGLGKEEIRELARLRGLSSWNKPSFACLASRVPYGTTLSEELLARIDAAEQLLLDAGLSQVRVRVHEAGTLARIEVEAAELARLLEPALRAHIDEALRALGFTYVALDLKGYRTGSMNSLLAE